MNVFVVTAFASGCAGLPAAVSRTPSKAIPALTDTALARIAAVSSPDPTLSGFRLLPSGAFALSTSIELLQRSERSLDLQYYLMQDDASGRHVLRLLRDAAQRGVRVRLLLDDLNTAGLDRLLLGLAAHPNVEVRLFNPFPAGRAGLFTRFAASLFDLKRLNRRMHNKLLIADGIMAVAGGRNIGDRYFMRDSLANFIDLDVFVSGAVVPELSRQFDQYWNSPSAYPLESIVPQGEARVGAQEGFEESTRAAQASPLDALPEVDVLGHGPIVDELNTGRLALSWGEVEAYADPPDTPFGDQSPNSDLQESAKRVRFNLLEHMRDAKAEVALISPYFIAGAKGMELIREIRNRGVKVSVLTNSLASTDQPFVHMAYLPYREALLGLGVDLHELSRIRAAQESKRTLFGSSVGGLHTKAAIFDHDKVFIGSMNFDPRSEYYNTETGLFIHSPEIAREALRLLDLTLLQAAHRLRLTASGQIEVLMPVEADGEVHLDEPGSGFWMRMLLNLVAPLVPEELL